MTNLAIGRKMREPGVSLNTLSYSSPEAVVSYFRKGDYLIGVAHVPTPVGVFRFATKVNVGEIELRLAAEAAKKSGIPLSRVVEDVAAHTSTGAIKINVGADGDISIGASPRRSILPPGQMLKRGQEIVSPNGRFRAVLQTDSNFVIYDGSRPLRAWGQNGTDRAFMQSDGNFVLYAGGQVKWASDTNGNGGARLVMQDDGNLVVYAPGGSRALWGSETDGGRIYESSRGLLPKLMAPITKPAEFVASKVTGRHIAVDPAEIIRAAQTVISFVPGVGTGINAAIAAGSALAKGENITDALVDGVRGSLPGGPLAQKGFDVAAKLVRAAASGQNIGEAALSAARDQIPGGEIAKKAFDVGLAVAHGQNVQAALLGAASAALPNAWQALAKLSPAQRSELSAFVRASTAAAGVGKTVTEAAQKIGAQKVLATVKDVTAALPEAMKVLPKGAPGMLSHLSGANFALPPVGAKTAQAFESANKTVRALKQVKELRAARLPVPPHIAKTVDKTRALLSAAKKGEPNAVKAAKLLKIASEFQSNVARLKASGKTPITSLSALNLSPAARRSLATTHSSSEAALLAARRRLGVSATSGWAPRIVMPGTPTGDIFFG